VPCEKEKKKGEAMPRDDRKVVIEMRVAVHPLKAVMWQHRAKIKPEMSLRQIAKVIGFPSATPQKIKHHLQAMVTMGAIDYIGGQYVFPKNAKD
jgi:hypothetical protein